MGLRKPVIVLGEIKRIRRLELASLGGARHSRRGNERIIKEKFKSERGKESVRGKKSKKWHKKVLEGFLINATLLIKHVGTTVPPVFYPR